MVTYTITDGTNTYNISELGITKNGEDLDLCTVIANGKFNNDTNVTIYYDTTAVFYGITKSVTEESGGSMYKTTCYERAAELKDMQYLSGSSAIFTKSSMTVDDLVDDILTGSGWARGNTDSTVITTLSCYYVNKMQALNKVIREMRGLYLWFNSNTKIVRFGTVGVDRSATPISYIEKKLKSSTEARNITKVVVLGKDASIIGTAGTGTKVATYQVSDIKTSSEATTIATSILADIGNEYVTYDVTISPDQYQYGARDKVTIDSAIYYVKNIDQTLNDIILTVDTGATSVISSLGSRITEVTGEFPTGSDASWSGGNTNVAANGSAYTTYIWDIKDINMISGAQIDATIGSFIKSADVSTATGDLSNVSTIDTTGSSTNTTLMTSPTYIPSSSGVTCVANNGYQFALATINGTLRAASGSSSYYLLVDCQWSTNGSTWNNTGTEYKLYFPYSDQAYPFSYSALIGGHTGSIYVRWRFRPSTDSVMGNYNTLNYHVQMVSRHTHSVATTYDKSTTGTPPSTVLIHINSGTDVTVTPGTPVALSGTIGTLVTGKNTIYIKTPAGSSNQCSVNPTITYQTLGKS